MYLMDYVRAQKRVPRAIEPYNEVDMLAFASLPYLELGEIVSDLCAGEDLTMREVAALYRKKMEGNPNPPGLFIPRDFIDILIEMEDAPRYSDLKVFGFRYEWSMENEEQFAALGVETPEGEIILSIAGTDDTLLGWKEDLNLAVNGHIAGQSSAVKYVNDVLRARDGVFTMTGYSKGGHLAVYAPALCDRPERLKSVYDFDGPGFRDDFLASDRFQAIKDRCLLIAPRYSAVSRMLNNIPNYVVTRGTRRGLYQHYSNRWIIEGSRFLREPDFAEGAHQFHTEFMEMLNDTTEEQRRITMDLVFRVAKESGAISLTDVWRNRAQCVPDMLAAVWKLPRDQRAVAFSIVSRTLRMIAKYYGVRR